MVKKKKEKLVNEKETLNAPARTVNANDAPRICPDDPLLQMIQSQSIRPGANLHIFEHNVSTSPAH